jgi:hypothetical protein
MASEFEEVFLNPDSEAERLWQGVQEAMRGAHENVVQLCEAIDLGVRVVEIMTTRRLQPLANEFPATIARLLDSPPAEVKPERDLLNPPKALRFVDALDMLCEAELPCISPPLHHGWEDRVVSCRRSRARARRVTGIALNADQRDLLMIFGAYRNRIFLLPPPVRLVPEEIFLAYPALEGLVNQLFASPSVDRE